MPKPNKKEEARLLIEERLVAEAEADDRETKRSLVEARLVSQAQAADQAIADEIERRRKLEAARLEAERLRREKQMAAERARIESELVATAGAEDAALEAKLAALNAAQEAVDISAAADTLLDRSTEAARRVLTQDWERIGALYSHWGAPTLPPGALVAGYRYVVSSKGHGGAGGEPRASAEAEEGVRELLTRLANEHVADARAGALARAPAAHALRRTHGDDMTQHIAAATGQPARESEMRLVSQLVRKGGYSERALAGEPTVLETLAHAYRPPPDAPKVVVKRPYTKPPKAQAPPLGARAPIWRQAPSAAGRGRKTPSHSMRACRFDARFSHWPGPVVPTQVAKAALMPDPATVYAASQMLAPAPAAAPAAGLTASAPPAPAGASSLGGAPAARPQSAQPLTATRAPPPFLAAAAHGGASGQRAMLLPRPRSAPMAHLGVSPLMQSEMRAIVTKVLPP